MSSSYRKAAMPGLAVSHACVVAAALALPVGTALAAQTYVVPKADLRAEGNDNFNLVPGGSSDSDVYGYIADLQALIGIATPRSDTSLRPRLKFQNYPDRDELERLEAFLDLRSQYNGERSALIVFGKYSRQDSYNAEQPGGEFDPLDPTDPANPDSGTILLGETRTLFSIRPNYTFELTERTRLGFEVDYRDVTYDAGSAQATQQTDYNFTIGQGFVSWSLDPRSDFSVGAYVSKYEAKDNSTDTDAYGGEVGYEYRWSETIGAEVSINYEQNDTTDYLPVPVEESTSGWGGTVTGYRQGEVSSWRVTAGRTFIPTGDGSKATSDQFRVQYDRDLTERLSFQGAARYEARNALGDGGGADRDYARADLTLKWMLAPTWYVQGGYSYIWEDRASAADDAANNKLFISVGYQGLARQNR